MSRGCAGGSGVRREDCSAADGMLRQKGAHPMGIDVTPTEGKNIGSWPLPGSGDEGVGGQ